jgi:hypothetical protein
MNPENRSAILKKVYINQQLANSWVLAGYLMGLYGNSARMMILSRITVNTPHVLSRIIQNTPHAHLITSRLPPLHLAAPRLAAADV